MYEGPIELFSVEDYSKQIDEQIEKAVYEVVTKIGINVNREELIKALEYDRNQYEKGYADGKKNNIEWIPVTERLPEKNMPCLLTVGKFHLIQIGTYSDLMGTINHKIFWRGEYGENSFENITEYVIAWMPLPKPYEEGA